MNPETLRIIDSIARDRNIDKESLFTDIETAMVSAARKHFGSLDTEEFRCLMDRLSGEIRMWRRYPPDEWDEETGEPIGEYTEEEIDIATLGRIPAQTAKQVMIQKFREEERASIYTEFSKRAGEIVTGTAQRYEGGAFVIQVDRAEGFMPRSEQIPGEQFQPGDRVRCMILDVKDMGNQVKIVLTRAHPDFIRRLFEIEVPEVNERIIEIKAMAREPGFRTKLAVSSIDSKVDAVGACVGVRGSRIKNIVDELGGEKIDIVRWNDSSQILIQNALKPAEVVDVSLCFELGRATVIVDETQLSLAIGRRGQNVRLAARLTGWDVDILTPGEYAKGLDIMVETLKQVDGVEESLFDQLAAMGVISVFDVEEVGEAILNQDLGLTEDQATAMIELSATRGRVVAEEQQRERQLEEQRRENESQVAQNILGSTTDSDDSESQENAAAEGKVTSQGDAEIAIDQPTKNRADAILSGDFDNAPAAPEADKTDEDNIDEAEDNSPVAEVAEPVKPEESAAE